MPIIPLPHATHILPPLWVPARFADCAVEPSPRAGTCLLLTKVWHAGIPRCLPGRCARSANVGRKRCGGAQDPSDPRHTRHDEPRLLQTCCRAAFEGQSLPSPLATRSAAFATRSLRRAISLCREDNGAAATTAFALALRECTCQPTGCQSHRSCTSPVGPRYAAARSTQPLLSTAIDRHKSQPRRGSLWS